MLSVETREPKKQLNTLRNSGKIPAVIYGRGFDSLAVQVDSKQFLKILKTEGEGTLWDLKVDDDEPYKVLLKEYQKDVLKDDYDHIDFYRIRMDEKMRTEIAFEFVEEISAELEGVGVLVKTREAVEVECLPKDLVPSIEVDVSVLKEVGNSLMISDLTIPKGIEVLEDMENIVANISEVKEEEEEITKEEEEAAIAELGGEGEEGAEGSDSAPEGKEGASPDSADAPEGDEKKEAPPTEEKPDDKKK